MSFQNTNAPAVSGQVANKRFASGFTLVELLIAVVIAAVLAAIALPSYTDYVRRTEMRSAQADLIALATNIENEYQRLLSYPSLTSSIDLDARYSGWSPTTDSNLFTFSATSISVDGAVVGYEIKATGKGSFTSCLITMNNSNARTATNCPAGSGGWI